MYTKDFSSNNFKLPIIAIVSGQTSQPSSSTKLDNNPKGEMTLVIS